MKKNVQVKLNDELKKVAAILTLQKQMLSLCAGAEGEPVQNNITKKQTYCSQQVVNRLLLLNKAAAEYNVPVKAAAGGYGASP